MEFSVPQQYVLTSLQDIILFLAGVGSGKSHLGGVVSEYYISNFPAASGFIGANTYNQLNTSTMLRIREVWANDFGLIEGRDYVIGKKPPVFWMLNKNFDRYDGICVFRNGAVVFLGSLDNAKAHDGKQFDWAILDETKDSREQDVKETILTRLRGKAIYRHGEELIKASKFTYYLHRFLLKQTTDENGTTRFYDQDGFELKPFNPLYIMTSPAKVPWINTWFKLSRFQEEIQQRIFVPDQFFWKDYDDKCVVISSTYHNQKNLPVDYIPKILNNNTEEIGKKLVYANPFTKTGGEFYSGFRMLKHTGYVPFIPGLPVHISFDQNVVPYITAVLSQVILKGNGTVEIRVFDEFCLANPKNTTKLLCEEIKRKYGDELASGIYFYGDPSGLKGTTRDEVKDYKRQNDYDIVKNQLREYLVQDSDRTTRKYPAVLKRRDFINAIFESKMDVNIMIDAAHCTNTITDFEYIKQDQNGKKLKEMVEDENGIKFEQYGHTSDAIDYFLCALLKRQFESFRNY